MCVLLSSVLCCYEGVLKYILFRFFKQVFVRLVVGVYMFVRPCSVFCYSKGVWISVFYRFCKCMCVPVHLY